MRVAIQNCWPNLPLCAEKEFINRALIAARRLSWDVAEVVTSDDIIAFDPDCVLVTHEFQPKLTRYPTIGLMWSPCNFFEDDPQRIKSILSYDGVIPGSERVASFLRDLAFAAGKDLPIADFLFHPSSQELEIDDFVHGNRSLFYAGVHWDGARFGYLFDELCRRTPIKIYGPPAGWSHIGDAYKGQIDFDGVSLFERIREAGISLCLHKEAHRSYEVPSMRIFEAVAAGALVITDEFAFPHHAFRNTVLYIDHDLPPREVVDRIVRHVDWANANPIAASSLARRANAIFKANFSLERLLGKIPAYLEIVRDKGGFVPRTHNQPDAADDRPMVEYIVRVGSRPSHDVERCLASLAAQTLGCIGIILVQFHPVDGLTETIEKWRSSFTSIKHVLVPNTGNRSTATWAGLRAVEAPFFGLQDDDDTIHPNHVASILDHFTQHPSAQFVYTGTVQIEDDPGVYFSQVNFAGPLGREVPENRHLRFLDPFSSERLFQFDNYIQSNAWLARRTLLTKNVLEDPEMEVGEDLYLYQLLAELTVFEPTVRPTAEWHWRTTSQSNSMLGVSQDIWDRNTKRIRQRHQFRTLDTARTDRAKDAVARDLAPPNGRDGAVGVLGTCPMGAPIDFCSPSAAHYIVSGFSTPEADGTWSKMVTASLEFRLPHEFSGDLVMEMRFIPVVTEHNGFVTVAISANNRAISQFQYEKWEEVTATLHIPATCLPSDHLLVGFAFANTFNPSISTGSVDNRDLGLLLKAVQFTQK